LGIGDWGLGPIPNPQSPFKKIKKTKIKIKKNLKPFKKSLKKIKIK
jgi:hypothetical protein